MSPRGVFRLVVFVLLTAGISAGTAFSQSSRTSKKPRAKHGEILVKAEPEPRSRRVMGDGERDRGEANGRKTAEVWSRATKDDDQLAGPRKPVESRLTRAGTFSGDLRKLPYIRPIKKERPEREGPVPMPIPFTQLAADSTGNVRSDIEADQLSPAIAPAAPAPTPASSFDGLDNANWGAGHPPDTNGDVGPTYFIQTINTSIGIYDKSTGARVAAFTFDTFMSQGNFGNLCDTDNFGDPVVLYDTFEDRWVITDFAFKLDASGNVVNPPGSFQCVAVSKTGNPITGGWNYYSINTAGGLGDYPKLGVWPDGIYMSVNMFDYAASGSFQNPRIYAFNKAQMYAGAPTVQVVSFDAPSSEFTLLPSNARLQTGTPPAGSPNYFASVWNYLNVVSVWKFHVDWNSVSASTFTGPFNSVTPTWWAQLATANQTAPSPANRNDELYARLMVQNQYTNIGGVESLWNSHTAGTGNPTTTVTATQSAVRYYQVKVTGGSVEANATQSFTYSPAGDTLWKYMPSVAVDRVGNMAIGYTTSNSTTNPALKYAGRLATDPVNAITQDEQTLLQGTGAQLGSCGGTCTRWGDYSAMSLDPDGCTFWYTNMYYATNGLNYLTRIGSFSYPSCSAISSSGTLQGTVVSSVTGALISGATISLGNRTTTTDSSGAYSFSGLPPGTYPSLSAGFSGYITGTTSSIAVPSGGTATRNFSLGVANDSSCPTDTSQSDFQTGVLNNTDLTTSAGDVILVNAASLDRHADDNGFGSGYGFTSTSLIGQTFTPGVTGQLTRVEAYIFCASCSGTDPNIIMEVRTTSGGQPVMTAAGLLASSTISGTSSAAGGLLTFSYSSPATLTAGTQYGIVIRLASNRATGTQAWLSSSGDVMSGGRRVACSTSSCSNPTGTNSNSDVIFKSYIKTGFAAAGDFVSGVKDSNPAAAGTTMWGSLSWTATTPVSTSIKFQVAGSNSAYGPFNFVGPDGTASTYYTTSGSSLSQFNGLRYLKYKAYLATINGTVTPTLSDVSFCFTNPRVWTGAVSTDWNNPSNWSSSGVPGSSDAAVIPATGVTNNPFNTSNASVGTIQLGAGRIIDTGANTLTVTNCSPAAIVGGNSTSYIKGTLTRCVNNTGTFVFPVATSTGYAPVSLGGIVGTGNFTVRPSNGFLTGTNVTQSIGRYWGLTPSGPTQADVTLTYGDADVPAGANEAGFKFIRQNGSTNTQFIPSSLDVSANTFTLLAVQSFSNWTLGNLLAPTAAPVSVGGRVRRASGQPIRGALVTITDASGNSRTSITNMLGNYQFTGVQAGRTYVVTASAKGYKFAPRVLTVDDQLTGFDIVASP